MFFEQVLIAIPLVVGAYLTLSLLKLPDFGIESAYLMGGVAAYLSSDLPLPLVLGCALTFGAFVGLTVVALNQIGNIPYLLCGIIANGLFHGLSHALLQGSLKTVAISSPKFQLLLAAGLVATGLVALTLRSELGVSLRIFGVNPLFFHHHNISKKYILFAGVSTGHALAGLSGCLFAHSNGFVDVTMPFGTILLCLTSLALGKLFQKRCTLLIPLIGTFAFFLMQQGLLRLGLTLYFNAFQALFLIGTLSLKRITL